MSLQLLKSRKNKLLNDLANARIELSAEQDKIENPALSDLEEASVNASCGSLRRKVENLASKRDYVQCQIRKFKK